MIRTMGTVFYKHYPFRSFILGLCHAYEIIKQSLYNYYNEVSCKLTIGNLPNENLTLYEKVDISKKVTMLIADGTVIAPGVTYIAGFPKAYAIDPAITSVEKITNGITKYTKEYTFTLLKGRLQVDTEDTTLWMHNVRRSNTYLKDSFAFLFGVSKGASTDVPLRDFTELLMFSLRYGLTKSLLEKLLTIYCRQPYCLTEGEVVKTVSASTIVTSKNTYTNVSALPIQDYITIDTVLSKYTPIFKAVTIEESSLDKLFYKSPPPNSEIIKNSYSFFDNNYGDTVYSSQRYYGDPYATIFRIKEETENITAIQAIATTAAATSVISNSNLIQYVLGAVPINVFLNIYIKTINSEQYNSVNDNVTFSKIMSTTDYYNNIAEGNEATVLWGQKTWGSFSYGDKTYREKPDIVIIPKDF